MKTKKMIYSEFNDKFSGLARLRYDRQDRKVEYEEWMRIKRIYQVTFVYSKKKDCTIVAVVALGYSDLFGPHDDDLCLIARYDGKVNRNTYIEDYHEDIVALCDETQKWFDMKMKEES